MEIKEFFKNVKEKTISLFHKLVEFCINNTKIAILSLLFFLLVLIVILLISTSNSKAKNEEDIIKNELILSQELLIPQGPEIQREYNLSRQTDEKWTEEEADKWFTSPSQKDIDNLNKANENIISEVLGAAP